MCCFWESPGSITFGGSEKNIIELRYVATGFMHTRREVYEKIKQVEKLPECNRKFGRELVPYFMPMVVEDQGEFHYLGDDYCFCERVKRAGYKILADATIRLWHIGKYKYGWEDAVFAMNRQQPFVMKLSDRNMVNE